MKEFQQRVKQIECGIVLDHLDPYTNYKAQKILGIEDLPALVIRNYPSRTMNKKDVVKVEVENEEELNKLLNRISKNESKIAFLAKNCTLTVIRNASVAEKHKVMDKLKEALQKDGLVEKVFKCTNYNCVSNQEKDGKPKFMVHLKNGGYQASCHYCNEIMTEQQIKDNIL